jgi:hypothetical protein
VWHWHLSTSLRKAEEGRREREGTASVGKLKSHRIWGDAYIQPIFCGSSTQWPIAVCLVDDDLKTNDLEFCVTEGCWRLMNWGMEVEEREGRGEGGRD